MPIFAYWISLGATLALALGVTLAFQIIPGAGLYGRKRAERLALQPWVDIFVFTLLALPWVVATLVGGAAGLLGACSGQALGSIAFSWIHRYAQDRKTLQPGPIRALAGRVGAVRVFLGLLISLSALPILIAMRAMQLTIWPVFARVMMLPRERSGMYFSFTRHKAKGMMGVDLLWALYTEWAMGVWALSAQIMRHAASLWCPMRFADDAKNTACATDFPDVARWGEPGDLQGAVRIVQEMHSKGRTSWFGHPSRATPHERQDSHEDAPEEGDAKQAA